MSFTEVLFRVECKTFPPTQRVKQRNLTHISWMWHKNIIKKIIFNIQTNKSRHERRKKINGQQKERKSYFPSGRKSSVLWMYWSVIGINQYFLRHNDLLVTQQQWVWAERWNVTIQLHVFRIWSEMICTQNTLKTVLNFYVQPEYDFA